MSISAVIVSIRVQFPHYHSQTYFKSHFRLCVTTHNIGRSLQLRRTQKENRPGCGSWTGWGGGGSCFYIWEYIQLLHCCFPTHISFIYHSQCYNNITCSTQLTIFSRLGQLDSLLNPSSGLMKKPWVWQQTPPPPINPVPAINKLRVFMHFIWYDIIWYAFQESLPWAWLFNSILFRPSWDASLVYRTNVTTWTPA